MRLPSWWRRVAAAGGVFALTFAACVLGPVVAALMLSRAFPPAFLLLYLPALMLWGGTLTPGDRAGPRWLSDEGRHHAIPLARGLRGRQRVAAAAGVIVAVTVGMHLALAVFDVHLEMGAL